MFKISGMEFPAIVMQCNVIMTNLKRHMQHKRLQGRLCTKIVNDAVNNTVKLKERIS